MLINGRMRCLDRTSADNLGPRLNVSHRQRKPSPPKVKAKSCPMLYQPQHRRAVAAVHTEKLDFTSSKDSSARPPIECAKVRNSKHLILQASSSSSSAKLSDFCGLQSRHLLAIWLLVSTVHMISTASQRSPE